MASSISLVFIISLQKTIEFVTVGFGGRVGR